MIEASAKPAVAAPPRVHRSRKSTNKLFLTLLTVPVYIFIFAPLLWLFSASLSNQVELYAVPPHWIPQHITFQNYLDIIFPSLAASSAAPGVS